MTLFNWITLALVPVTNIISWLVARRIRNNSTLQQLQESIDMLVVRNRDLYNELVAVRHENAELKAELREIRNENAELKAELDKLNDKLNIAQ